MVKWRDPAEVGPTTPCRAESCTAPISWLIETDTNDGDYRDVSCGRHLVSFLNEWVWKGAATATLTRVHEPIKEIVLGPLEEIGPGVWLGDSERARLQALADRIVIRAPE